MPSYKKPRKSSDNNSTIHRIGSFPKHMSRSWPADIEGINHNNNNSTFSSTTDLSHSYDTSEGTVSWLGKVLTKIGVGGHANSTYDNYDEYPNAFPFRKYLKESRICLFSNNLYLEDKFDKLGDVTILRLTRNIFHSFGDGISRLPQSLGRLGKTLTELDLRGNPLHEFPTVISELTNLDVLNLESCDIPTIPEEIKHLTKLRKLYLDNNQIKSPQFLSLPSLEHLYLGNNGITDISGIQLLKLSVIDLSDNFIEKIPDTFLDNCILKRLLLRGNSIQKLPNSVCTLSTLSWLDVSKNILKKLPEHIGQLSNLKYLNISWNDLTALPESIVNLVGLRKDRFFCGENPLQKPPYEVAVEGPKSIESYFKALNSGSSNFHNKRLKLMILGDEKTGKTTLAKAIFSYIEPEAEEERTIGLDFFNWKAEPKEDGLQVLLVDCAGQKKYILTHHMFMSTGLLFAVVVNLKIYTKELHEQQVGEWIDLVLARVPKAVILIVPTHIDLCEQQDVKEKCDHILETIAIRVQHIRKENEKDIRGSRSLDDEIPILPTSYKLVEDGVTKVYPQSNLDSILSVDPTSSLDSQIFMIPVSNKKHLEGMTLLRKEIIRIAYNKKLCPNINHILPESWVQLEQLCLVEQTFRKTITVDELYEKASSFFETKDDLIKALCYIDSIGPILYFHSIVNIRDIVFLDPKWLSLIFKLIFRHDSNKVFVYKEKYESIYEFSREFDQDKGYLLDTALLSQKFLRCIWYDDFKENDYFQQIVALLKNFDLAIDVNLPSIINENNNQYMLVPWFLPDTCHCPIMNKKNKLMNSSITTLVQTKGILPGGFFQRFIIKVYSLKLFNDCFPWTSGFIGITEDHRIKCLHEKIDNQSCIIIEGQASESSIYHMWEIIIPLLMALKDFIKEWNGIKYKTYSVCPTCYRHRGPKGPQFWELDLEKLHDSHEPLTCRSEFQIIDKWLIFPPPTIAMKFLPQDTEKTQLIEQKLNECLTVDEKDLISNLIGDRCREFRKVLNVYKGQLEPVHSQTDWRERVLTVIKLWEQNNEDASIRRFVEHMHMMKPLPHNVVEICITTPSSCSSP